MDADLVSGGRCITKLSVLIRSATIKYSFCAC